MFFILFSNPVSQAHLRILESSNLFFNQLMGYFNERVVDVGSESDLLLKHVQVSTVILPYA